MYLPYVVTPTLCCVGLSFPLPHRISLREHTIIPLSIQHGHLCAFQFGVLVNSASTHILVLSFWWIHTYISVKYTLRNGVFRA